MRYLFIVLLVGCQSMGDRISEVREAANECKGKVKLEVAVLGDREDMQFTCEWENRQ